MKTILLDTSIDYTSWDISETGNVEMTDWQPIETAPKDGMVLVYEDEHKEYYVAQINKHGAWEYASTDMWPKGTFNHKIDFICMPTHWMPLPPPPKKGDE